MPLSVAGLASELAQVFEQVAQNEPSPGAIADLWARAIGRYLSTATLPPPGPGILLGQSAMSAAMAPAMALPPPAGLQALIAGLSAFVLALAPTTLPVVTLPPVGPCPITPLPPATAEAAATALASIIHTWMQTGLSGGTVVPPVPPQVPWT